MSDKWIIEEFHNRFEELKSNPLVYAYYTDTKLDEEDIKQFIIKTAEPLLRYDDLSCNLYECVFTAFSLSLTAGFDIEDAKKNCRGAVSCIMVFR